MRMNPIRFGAHICDQWVALVFCWVFFFYFKFFVLFFFIFLNFTLICRDMHRISLYKLYEVTGLKYTSKYVMHGFTIKSTELT